VAAKTGHLRSGTLAVLAANAVINGSGVLFHRAMSGGLGDQYGRLYSLMAFASVLSAFTLGVSTFMVKEFSQDMELHGPGAVKGRLLELRRPLGVAFALIALALLALGPWVMGYLHLPSFAEYALVVGMFFGGLLLLMLRASLQGLHHFKALSFSISLEGLGRVGGAWILVGLGVPGGLLGMLTGQVLGMLAAATGLFHLGEAVAPAPDASGERPAAAVFRELSADTLALTLCTALTFIDLFVVKHNYEEAAASSYSRAALVSKSFLYLASALNMVLLPAVARAKAGGRDTRKLLMSFLGAALAINLAGLAFVWRFTDFVVRLLCGADPQFLALSPLVRIFSVAVVLQAMLQLLIYYLLALRSKAALGVLAVLVPAYYLLLSWRHESPEQVVSGMGLMALLGLLASLGAALQWWPAGKLGRPGAGESL
jgi:O-antigen/teichoic acid export membrane protein